MPNKPVKVINNVHNSRTVLWQKYRMSDVGHAMPFSKCFYFDLVVVIEILLC